MKKYEGITLLIIYGTGKKIRARLLNYWSGGEGGGGVAKYRFSGVGGRKNMKHFEMKVYKFG